MQLDLQQFKPILINSACSPRSIVSVPFGPDLCCDRAMRRVQDRVPRQTSTLSLKHRNIHSPALQNIEVSDISQSSTLRTAIRPDSTHP